MNVLEVSAKVATLSEGLATVSTGEGPLSSVLSKVISEIATLLEDAVTAWILALEEELDALCVLILHLDGLMPLLRYASESL